jgi:hypothetical protein
MNSKDEKELSIPMIEKIAYRYLAKLTELPVRDTDTLHLLSEGEIKTIKKEVFNTLFWAAMFGVIGVLTLYLPQYYFPELFYEYKLILPFSDNAFSIPIVSILYGFILLYIEITH